MKRLFTYFLPSLGAITMMLPSCHSDEPTSPPPPKQTRQTILVNTADELLAAIGTPAKDNHTIEIEWADDIYVSNQNDNIIGMASDLNRTDMTIDDKGFGIYYGSVVVYFNDWSTDTKSHKIVADPNGNWHTAANKSEQELWNHIGYTHIKSPDIFLTIDLSVDDAKNFTDFGIKLLAEYPTGIIKVDTNGYPITVWQEFLTNVFCRYFGSDGARLGLDDNAKIGMIKSDSISWDIGYTNSGLWSKFTDMNGGETIFRYTGPRIGNDADRHAEIKVDSNIVAKQNMVLDYYAGNQWTDDAKKGNFIVISPDLLPLDKTIEHITEEGMIYGEGLWFNWPAEKLAFPAYVCESIDRQLIQDADISFLDAISNSNVLKEYLREHRISVLSPFYIPGLSGYKEVMHYSRTEKNGRKDLQNTQVFEFPALVKQTAR